MDNSGTEINMLAFARDVARVQTALEHAVTLPASYYDRPEIAAGFLALLNALGDGKTPVNAVAEAINAYDQARVQEQAQPKERAGEPEAEEAGEIRAKLAPKTGGLTPTQRTMRASIAANTLWQEVPDRTAFTAPARKAFDERFEKEVDPQGLLDPAERARRAANARKAYFQRMAFASAKARRARAQQAD